MPRLFRSPRVSVPARFAAVRPDLGAALRRAGTPGGQLVGVTLVVVPAITNALPLTGAAHTLLQVVAVVVGTLGMVVVFGGLLQRAVLRADSPLDATLLAVPHARATWRALALVTVLLLAGALACLVLAFGDHPGARVADALMLALPGLLLAGATWRARVMRTATGAGDQLSADPAFHLDQDTFQS